MANSNWVETDKEYQHRLRVEDYYQKNGPYIRELFSARYANWAMFGLSYDSYLFTPYLNFAVFGRDAVYLTASSFADMAQQLTTRGIPIPDCLVSLVAAEEEALQ